MLAGMILLVIGWQDTSKMHEIVRFTQRPWCVNIVTGGTGAPDSLSSASKDKAGAERHAGGLIRAKDTLYQAILYGVCPCD